MARKKSTIDVKRQLGQFMTPDYLSEEMIDKLNINISDKILEPSFGKGSFILKLIDRFFYLYGDMSINNKLDLILTNNIWGIELDVDLYNYTINEIKCKYGYMPDVHNLYNIDFFKFNTNDDFDIIIGNPPFGGTFDLDIEKDLEKIFGNKMGNKIKKETYSFFIIKSLEMLKGSGRIIFILSDTFLTINTMSGLRKYLFNSGYNEINRLKEFSSETYYPMVILNHQKDKVVDFIVLDDKIIKINDINKTSNFSWSINKDFIKYFNGDTLSNYLIASGGLTTGKNEYFLRNINDGKILEEYDFSFFQEEITIDVEISKARYNMISEKKKYKILKLIEDGITFKDVKITKLDNPYIVSLPNGDYKFYSKSNGEYFYSKPDTVIYWKNNGEAVRTYKKNNNWYLQGMGGEKFYEKEGITWQLISDRIKPRYLPTGYIIDNSSPIAILKDGIDKNEFYFIIGWLATDLASDILKNVINHTRNIQNKDIERMPYPFWVKDNKSNIITLVKNVVDKKLNGDFINITNIISELNNLFKI
jgi:tRNA1(Val) A37 N6-methylase TrmN6